MSKHTVTMKSLIDENAQLQSGAFDVRGVL